jgi:two-component system CheB/CheR fusion protein
VGASAGGLDALQRLLGPAPAQTRLAFVVVQHLAPSPPSRLAELLARHTPLGVQDAEHGQLVGAGQVYVAPAGCEVALHAGRLQVSVLAPGHAPARTVDHLFETLAADQGASAVGVVLSGMGSDGSQGLRALSAQGALCLVQQPDTADFDSMPLAALLAVPGAHAAPPEQLVGHILSELQAGPGRQRPGPDTAPDAAVPPPVDPALEDPLAAVLALLRARTGHDFSAYKPATLQRRTARRLALHGLPTLADYVDVLRHNVQELDLLFKELLIGVTGFFRDEAAWISLQQAVLPGLVAQAVAEGQPLRAWVPGCSTGEEAYTLAMVVAEVAAQVPGGDACRLQLFATDLNDDAIERARRGVYPEALLQSVSAARQQRFFNRGDSGWRVVPSLRDAMVFARHDLSADPPFTRLHLLSCRNLLIYFGAALQQRLMPVFHYALRPGGVLMLGGAETVGRQAGLFDALDERSRIYRRATGVRVGHAMSFPVRSPVTDATAVAEPHVPAKTDLDDEGLSSAMAQMLLAEFAPAAVLVNAQGDILFVNGRTGRYLEPAAGRANWNVHAMARDGLRTALSAALRQATDSDGPVLLQGLAFDADDPQRAVDVTVTALLSPAALRGQVLIVFRETAALQATDDTTPATAELHRARDEIAALRHEMRHSNEQVQAANEELQAANEELQSANEELMSSKEEVQSMNEELQTINAELQGKVDALTATQNDLKNLLDSTDIATLFLDAHLNVRRFTEQARRIVSLRESDLGRPLAELTMRLPYPELAHDVLETLRTLTPCERQLQGSDGRWISVRVMTYRTLDNRIDGAVLTFVDITAARAAGAMDVHPPAPEPGP